MKIFVTGGFVSFNYTRFGAKECPDWQKGNLGKLTLKGNLKDLYDIQGSNFKSTMGHRTGETIFENWFAQEKFDAVTASSVETHEFRSVLESLPFVEMCSMEREGIKEWFMGNVGSFYVRREGHGK